MADGCEPARVSTAGLRIACYNIHRAVGSDRRRDPARIAAVIGALRADVIGLQEVDWHHDHDAVGSQFAYLARLPGYQAVAGPILRDHRGHYGNLLLTRLAVRRVRRIDLSQPGREPRGAIDADLDLDRDSVPGSADAALRVIVTHLGLGTRERWRQARRLGALVAECRGQPTVLLGDLNEWLPGSPTLRPLMKLCRADRCPASYPAFRPLLALDRILTCGCPSPLAVEAHGSPLARRASDHLPVVAELGACATR